MQGKSRIRAVNQKEGVCPHCTRRRAGRSLPALLMPARTSTLRTSAAPTVVAEDLVHQSEGERAHPTGPAVHGLIEAEELRLSTLRDQVGVRNSVNVCRSCRSPDITGFLPTNAVAGSWGTSRRPRIE